MAKLTGKIAVIAGGTTGIGLATAQLYQQEGATVVVTGRNPATLAAAQATLGPNATVIASDASSLADIDALAALVGEKFGRVDVLFANAGIAQFAPVEGVSEPFYDNQFNLNVKGLFFTVQKLLPLIPQGGAVILNASIVSVKGMGTTSIYAATKAAVRSFGRTLATELAPKGIRVNTISPGPIATPIYDKLGMPKEMLDQFAAGMAQSVALKRFGQPEEIAKVALFFGSDDSSYVTGTELFVDGGLAEL